MFSRGPRCAEHDGVVRIERKMQKVSKQANFKQKNEDFLRERRLFDLRSGVCRRFPSEIRECSVPKCSPPRALTHGAKISARFDDLGDKSPKIRLRPRRSRMKKIFVLA